MTNFLRSIRTWWQDLTHQRWRKLNGLPESFWDNEEGT